METIPTPRLHLVACSPETVGFLIQDREAFASALGVAVPNDWPPEELREVLHLFCTIPVCWGLWLILHSETRAVVGSIGFTGPPDESGTVEVGYGVQPASRGKGYAREAVQALIAWASNQPEVRRIIAQCEEDNAASISVLEGVGMHRTGTKNGLLEWELPPSAG